MYYLQRVSSALSRPTLSAPALTFLTLVWVVVIDNLALWREVGRRLDPTSLVGAGYAITLSTLMVLLLLLPLLLLVPRVLLKPVLVFLLILSGVMAYFIDELGVVVGETARAAVQQDTRTVSHDNLSATLLGLYDVRTSLYEPSLDLFSPGTIQARPLRPFKSMKQNSDAIALSLQ